VWGAPTYLKKIAVTTQNTIETVNQGGTVVLRASDGSYVLAQQIDAKPLRAAQVLEGELDGVGVSSASDPETGVVYEFFVEAYGLSRDAALAGE
jgi:hypothetical protein